MKNLRSRIVTAALAASAVLAAAPSTASALPTLPSNAGEITADIDWSKVLSPLVKAGDINCTVTSATGTAALIPGITFSPTSTADALTLLSVLRTPTANVVSDCSAVVTPPASTVEVSGTFTAPNLAAVQGVGGAGTVALKCTVSSSTPTVTVTVTAAFGGAVTNKARIAPKTGVSGLGFDCTMAMTFTGGAALSGTAVGTITIGDPVANTLCGSQSTVTCMPATVTNAAVSIFGGSGALADVSGSGTYSFDDTFRLSDLESTLATASAFSVREAGVRAAATTNSDRLNLTMTAGKPVVKLLQPTGSSLSFGKSVRFRVMSAPAAKCTVTATLKRKTVTVATGTLPGNGIGEFSISTANRRKMTAAGIVKGSKVSLKTACRAGTQTTTLTKSAAYTG